jgi:hypothetical protein
MGNKLKINEQQLAVLVNYIKEGKINSKKQVNETELLEEGWKENLSTVALSALLILGGMGKADAQSQTKADNLIQHSEIMVDVKDALENTSGISSLATEFKISPGELKSYMQKNSDQIESTFNNYAKKKNLAISLQIKDNQRMGGLKSKVERGQLAITGIEEIVDTIWQTKQPATMSDTLTFILADGQDLKTKDFKLPQEKIDVLQGMLNQIASEDGKLTKVRVISKTDAERVPSYYKDSDPTGNFRLAKERANEAVKVIKGSNIDFGSAEWVIDDSTYVNGGDSPLVSTEEFRASSNDDTKTEKLRLKSADERGVIIQLEYEITVTVQDENGKDYLIKKVIKVSTVRASVVKGGGSYRPNGGGGDVPCKWNIPTKDGKIKSLPCKMPGQ